MRRPPTSDEKLAAALLHMALPQGGTLHYVFTSEEREQLKGATAAQICSLFHYDHSIHHALAETPEEAEALMHPTNLTPRLIVGHRIKTATQDVPQIAKTKRIQAAQTAHRQVLARVGLSDVTVDTIRARPKQRWPQGRKMQSRPMRGKKWDGR